MRVPTYKRQSGLSLQGRGGGRLLTASLNPSAATAVARTISDIGDAITEIGMKKLEIETATEVNVAEKALTTELQQIKTEALKEDNPVSAERKAKKSMQELLRQYQTGLKINPITKQPYLTSNKSKAKFSVVGQDVFSAAFIDYTKENNKRIVEINKANVSSQIDKNVQTIINAETFGDKNEAFKKIFSVNKNQPGILLEALTSGTFKEKEYSTQFDTSAEIAIDGLVLKEMKKSPSALAVGMEIVDGKSDNVMLNTLMGLVKDKVKLRDKILKAAEEFDEDRTNLLKEEEEEKDKIDDALFSKIINVDVDNATDFKIAKENHKKLMSRGYYKTTAQRKSVEMLLGIAKVTTKGSDKSDRSAIETMEIADRNNSITAELIKKTAPGLSDGDYKKYSANFRAEQAQGYKEAVDFFRTKLSYNENSDASGIGGKNLQLLFDSAKSELFDWRQKQLDDGKPLNYKNTIQEARNIYDKKEIDFRKLMKKGLIEEIENANTLMTNKIVYDPLKPLQSAKDYIENNPGLFPTSDLFARGMKQKFELYEKFRVDEVSLQ